MGDIMGGLKNAADPFGLFINKSDKKATPAPLPAAAVTTNVAAQAAADEEAKRLQRRKGQGTILTEQDMLGNPVLGRPAAAGKTTLG